MEIAWYIFFFITGSVFGSFMNVLIDRVPAHQSLIKPASHCPVCNQALKALDLIPVFSYIVLRGKCRYCRAPIPRRVLVVEILTGLLFVFLLWFCGFSWNFLLLTFYGCIFIVISVIDLEKGIIPNIIVYIAAVIVIILLVMRNFDITTIAVPGIIWAAIGLAIGFIFFFVLALVYRGGMGFGDVKLAGLIGLITGFPLILVSIMITAGIGGVAAVVLLISKAKGRKDTVPFGPFLCIGAMVALLWGPLILSWYLGLGGR
jgi:leader peptidase (prepilin peptidase) / N-methyltransferase